MILCILGPTGVGKTKLSIALAKKYHAIIINCDAMQMYQGLNIGTAKIKEEEKEKIPHYLFDFVSVTENYTVKDYQKEVRKLLEEHKQENIIFVGGSGLYLKSALYDYEFLEDTFKNYDAFSNEELLKMCKEKDPLCNIHVNNRVRLLRFLNRSHQPKKNPKLLYPAIFIGLTTDRGILYEKINERVEEMFKEGLLEEVEAFYQKKIRTRVLETAIGYKELYEYLDGKITFEDAKEKIKQNSRHYAKRQYTFFKHQFDLKWFTVNYQNFNHTIKEVEDFLK